MKKIILMAIACFVSLFSYAETADAIFNKTLSAYKSAKGLAVKYSMTGSAGNASGEIAMQGNKFCITSSNMICWYNGKTQWSYSSMSNEVSIMEPTANELQIVNPMLVISNFQKSYTATLGKSSSATASVIILKPKNAKTAQYSSVALTVNKKTYLPSKIIATLKDKSKITISLSGYKTGCNFPASTFVYDKKYVPAGVQVVDLR